jgi:nucleotide-binding universal stress UspA family protein
MDYQKLKRRPSYPFETIGVALAFSPRLEGVLGEAWKFAQVFDAQLLLMHIGERTRTKEAKLDELMDRLGIDEPRVRIIWSEGDPVNTLLELCKLNIVDLLVLGAMRKENMFRFYLGSVARSISRKAKCSVLLLTEPNAEGSTFKKLVVNSVESPKTIHTINTAIYFAEHVCSKDIVVATEVHQPGLAMTMAGNSTAGEASKIKREFTDDEANRMHAIVTRCRKQGDIEITEKIIKGKPGFAIRQFAETKKADLLVINSPDVKYGLIDRIFTHDMEYILEDLPCNVLIVHSRIS